MIRLTAIRRSFGAFELGPISLEIADGDYWVVLGPSGSGKSMLLQTLAGAFVPDSGGLHMDDEDMTEAPPERRKVGLVFQEPALFPHMSVLDNIDYGLRAAGLHKGARKRRVDEVVASVGAEPLLQRPVATLSGGEARKVALARALAPRPRLLLLDEPFGPIDYNTRQELQAELERIHGELGVTTVHVTHDREEARALSDHCAVMLGGTMVQSGETTEVFAQPRCEFVARFLGVGVPEEAPGCSHSCMLSQHGRCEAVAGSG